MSLPVILRQEAEVDVQEARDQLEAVRVGLGTQVLARVREVLARIEKMPELHGKVWQDVRAARLNSKCVANQASEQTRDSVRRHGEPIGRELLNLVVMPAHSCPEVSKRYGSRSSVIFTTSSQSPLDAQCACGFGSASCTAAFVGESSRG